MPDSQTFLREFDKKLWTAADKPRSTGKLIDDALEAIEKEKFKGAC